MSEANRNVKPHSSAWVAQVWISFIVSSFFTSCGIFFLPVDPWVKGFLGMGLLFTIGSTLNLAKTTRDLHESEKLVAKVEDARVERLLVQHDALRG